MNQHSALKTGVTRSVERSVQRQSKKTKLTRHTTVVHGGEPFALVRVGASAHDGNEKGYSAEPRSGTEKWKKEGAVTTTCSQRKSVARHGRKRTDRMRQIMNSNEAGSKKSAISHAVSTRFVGGQSMTPHERCDEVETQGREPRKTRRHRRRTEVAHQRKLESAEDEEKKACRQRCGVSNAREGQHRKGRGVQKTRRTCDIKMKKERGKTTYHGCWTRMFAFVNGEGLWLGPRRGRTSRMQRLRKTKTSESFR
ncbi:hypothetical protein TRVL_07098 [Trypanosoma vivax]|nr:hypothetical protein TRVL_07098 [Trypanosoma vivax]